MSPLVEPIYVTVHDSAMSMGVGRRAVLWDEETKMWSDSPDGTFILFSQNDNHLLSFTISNFICRL